MRKWSANEERSCISPAATGGPLPGRGCAQRPATDLEAQEPQDALTLMTFLGCLATNRMMKGESPGKIFLFLGLPDWILGPLSIPQSILSPVFQLWVRIWGWGKEGDWICPLVMEGLLRFFWCFQADSRKSGLSLVGWPYIHVCSGQTKLTPVIPWELRTHRSLSKEMDANSKPILKFRLWDL